MKYVLNPFLGVLMLCLFSVTSYSQSWQETKESAAKSVINENSFSKINTAQHKNFQVDYSSLKKLLHKAPFRTASSIMSGQIVKFPTPQGQLVPYRLQRVLTMHPDLAAKYPGIASYTGYSTKDVTKTIRITETPNGIHATLNSNESISYVTPVALGGKSYKVYDKNDIIPDKEMGRCLIDEEQTLDHDFFYKKNSTNAVQAISDGKFRTLRMAIVTTAEFSQYYINKAKVGNGTDQEKKAAVVAGLNVLLNSLNDLFEEEFSISMVLIPDNDKIIFLDSQTDGLSNNNTRAMLNEGNAIMNEKIGLKNFDIGHTLYQRNGGGGGVASFFAPCNSRDRGRAVSGQPIPEGDGFVYTLWAHEVGHQFTGAHTFNNSCNENRDERGGSVEPGSGSTIMSYAGICAPNIQRREDRHFHGLSHKQISQYIIERVNPSNTCGVTVIENNNSAPVIAKTPDYTIPTDTPFVLSAAATDADNDILTYQFDQMDSEITPAPPQATAEKGPVFRSIFPTTKPFRYFPSMPDILNNNLAPKWEVIPSVSRKMKFTVTVRDVRNNLGSQSAFSDFNVNFVKTAPFKVTSQNENTISWISGEQHEITWDVAGTTANGIDTQNVTVLLTTNGGKSFDTVLAASTPNDGAHTITIPNNITSQNARIMVKAIDNVFFALNRTPIQINVNCNDFSNTESIFIPDTNEVATSSINVNEKENSDLVSLKVTLDMEHRWVGDLTIKLVHPNGTEITLWKNNCNSRDVPPNGFVFDDSASPISCPENLKSAYAPVDKLSNLQGLKINGTWKLLIQDNTRGEAGRLNSWKMDICTGDTTNLSVTNFNTLKGTQIYPNPNNGVFTADFGKNNASVYKITLFDLLGRKIFSANYNNAKSLINIQNISKGNYLLLLETEGKKALNKIVIE